MRERSGVLDLELVTTDDSEDEDADDLVIVLGNEVAPMLGIDPRLERGLTSRQLSATAMIIITTK